MLIATRNPGSFIMAIPCDSRELRKHAGRLQAGIKVHTLPTLSQAHVPVN